MRAAWRIHDLDFVLADLRHLYEQMVGGSVKDAKSAANGLLAPAIRRLEAAQWDVPDPWPREPDEGNE